MNLIIGGFKFTDIDDNLPHVYGELMCVKCYKRWIGVFPKATLLKNIECPQCHEQGYAIMTGQIDEAGEEE